VSEDHVFPTACAIRPFFKRRIWDENATAPLTNAVFLAVDVETTGLSPDSDNIVEIGAVEFNASGVVRTFATLVNPGRPIPASATALHGITDTMVAHAPPFRAAVTQLLAMAEGKILVAHNARFDAAFLRSEMQRNGIPIPALPVLDSMTLSRAFFPEAKPWGLDDVARFLNIERKKEHRSLEDAMAVVEILRAAISRLPSEAMVRDLTRAAGGTRPMYQPPALSASESESPRASNPQIPR
jgi:DNA polymerase-3 subunit epsilon